MAVRYADKALDAWLTEQIKIHRAAFEANRDPWDSACLMTLESVQNQLHAFWGADMIPGGTSAKSNDI